MEKEEDLLNLAYNSLRKKVAYGLVQQIVHFREAGKSSVTLNLSRKEMAQAIGVATESLIRTLTEFKDEKLLTITAGQVVILDEMRLKNLSN